MGWLNKLHIKIVNSSLWHHLYYKRTKEFKKMLSDVEKNALEFRNYCENLDEFPCKHCKYKGDKECIKSCDFIEKDIEVLAALVAKHKCCPDCGSKDLRGGPAQNVLCANCNHQFNFCLGAFMHRIFK